MGITNGWRNKSIFISILLMLAGLFISRAVLSITMMLFLALTLLHKDFFSQVKGFLANLFLVGIAVLFFIPFVSGLWSSDLKEWSEIVRIKLPLLLFPIAFAGQWKLSDQQWKAIALSFVLLISLGCGWTLLQYVPNASEYNEGYLKAKLLITPMENDHIRFSWLISVAVILCFLAWQQNRQTYMRIAISALLVFFAAYLHVLASRMGLFCFYLSLLIFGLWFFVKRKNKITSVVLLIAMVLAPVIAWLVMPTFQNRVKYIVYDLSNVKADRYLPGSNDGARILSLKAGWQLVKENPFGTGAGDLKPEMNTWYATNAPQLNDRFLPCSEWLVYGGFGGWPAMTLLPGILLLPFFQPVKRNSIFWYCLNAIVVFSFVFDMAIEAQFGVFVYAFIVLWWWKWFRQTGMHE